MQNQATNPFFAFCLRNKVTQIRPLMCKIQNAKAFGDEIQHKSC